VAPALHSFPAMLSTLLLLAVSLAAPADTTKAPPKAPPSPPSVGRPAPGKATPAPSPKPLGEPILKRRKPSGQPAN
jgi:hypothetical protein